MTTTAASASAPASRGDHVKLVRASVSELGIATMLYGSCARGTADAASDVDVLQIVERDAKAYSLGRINVTQYLPTHLLHMARRGSLFVLHLTSEGRLVHDPADRLKRLLAEYRKPANYLSVRREISAAARALDTEAMDIDLYLPALGRLGVYLARTLAYVRCAERGTPVFDTKKVVTLLDAPELFHLLNFRRKAPEEFDRIDLDALRAALSSQLDQTLVNPFGSVESLAVSLDKYRQARALLVNVLTGTEGHQIDYAAVSLLPF